jgi:hypothetical protein
VGFEVGHSHLTAGDERGHAREEAQCDQAASCEFDDSGSQTLWISKLRIPAQRSEELLRAMAGEQQANKMPATMRNNT